MSEQNDMLRMLYDNERRLKQTETREVPPLYLPWHQRLLNPVPLATGGQAWGDMAQPWAVTLLAFYCSVFVLTTNNGTNFWTIELIDAAGSTLASFTTAAIGANSWERLVDLTITQPASSNKSFAILPTATLSPGSIFIVPALALLRTGN